MKDMSTKVGRQYRVLRRPSITLIGVITVIIGISLLFFMMQLADATSGLIYNEWRERGCVRIIFLEYEPDHNELSRMEHVEYHKVIDQCLEP